MFARRNGVKKDTSPTYAALRNTPVDTLQRPICVVLEENKDVMELEQQLLNLNQDTDIAFPGLVASRISELDSIRTEIESYKRRSLKATSISASKKDSLKPRHISTNLNTKLSKKQSKGVARPKSKPARDDSMDWFTDVGAAYCIAP